MQFTKLLFQSGCKSSVSLDVNVSAEVVGTKTFNTTRNFPCTVRQSPVVSTTLKASLVSTTVPTLKAPTSGAEDPGFESSLRRNFSGVESYQ